MNSLLEQNIFPTTSPFPRTIKVHRHSIHEAGAAVCDLLENQPGSSMTPIGIACHISNKGDVDFMSIANTTSCLLISFSKKRQKVPKNLSTLLSAGGDAQKYYLSGFSMARTAIQVSEAIRVRVKGTDLADMNSPEKIVKDLIPDANTWKISLLWMGGNKTAQSDMCLQAWLAACVGSLMKARIETASKVDSAFINPLERSCLSRMISQAELRERFQSKENVNDFTKATVIKDGKIEIVNSRYKTRVRRSEQTRVIMTDSTGHRFVGRSQASKGKTTTVGMNTKISFGPVRHIKVVGRQDPTNSEKARDAMIFMLLAGKKTLRESPMIRAIWFPQWKKIQHLTPIDVANPADIESTLINMKLNSSQQSVVRAMTCDVPITIAHGPPGTGKTTTISTASLAWQRQGYSVWIVAHSNVAVKNIAESLSKLNVDYKLLVSREFYLEWHEHIYTRVQDNLIRSDELPDDVTGMGRKLGGSRIVLCTLSMVSNPSLHENGTFKIVPMERLVIDEASQIDTFEFMHIFEMFHKTLGKVCFFGDPKQRESGKFEATFIDIQRRTVPPYGKDDIPSIRTIFDVKHLSDSKNDFFLDTQYRMPIQIGGFLSAHVYNGRLKSEHSIKDGSCVAFIDVPIPRASEEKVGKSWRNMAEVQSVVHVIKFYYKHKNFCVITPYDPQRAAIQKALEAENLPADSVYAVDSFQGNEADFIIISAVRTGKAGFLVSPNRMNVMLSRCKKAMVILTSQSFLAGGGAETLLGTLAKHWTKKKRNKKAGSIWIDWRDVANGVADLPGGAFGPNRSKNQVQR